MHGHFCLHDLIVFSVMVWEGLSCCLSCGRVMLRTSLQQFKLRSKHQHGRSGLDDCAACHPDKHRTE